MEYFEKQITSAHRDPILQRIEVTLAVNEDSVIGPERRFHSQNVELIKSWEQQKDSLERFGRKGHRLGSVFAGSGLLMTKNFETVKDSKPCILDWALIQINPERGTDEAHVSQLQFYLTTSPFALISLRFTSTNSAHQISPYEKSMIPGAPFHSTIPTEKFYTDNPSNCESLFKAGRTTHYTQGVYSGLESAHVAYGFDGQGRLVTKATTEHAVTGIDGKNFSDRGDSGSFVLNNLGHVVELLFGGSNIKNVSYFTHAADLVTHIKEMTGAKGVRLLGSDLPPLWVEGCNRNQISRAGEMQ